MKQTFRLTLALFAVSAMLLLHSCSKTTTPKPEINQEEYDAFRITFIKLDANGQQTTDSTEVNFDKSGTPTPSQVTLTSGTTYRMLATLFNNGASVNDEIAAEGTIHRFFYLPSASGYLNYSYTDADANGKGIGLDGKMTVLQSGNPFQLTVILRHGIDKTKPGADPWNSTNYEQAGGEDDVHVFFNIKPQ